MLKQFLLYELLVLSVPRDKKIRIGCRPIPRISFDYKRQTTFWIQKCCLDHDGYLPQGRRLRNQIRPELNYLSKRKEHRNSLGVSRAGHTLIMIMASLNFEFGAET